MAGRPHSQQPSLRVAAVIAAAVATYPLPAWSYLDPNTGGLLFQLLFPLFAAVIAFWSFVRNKTKSAFAALTKALGRNRAE